MHDWGNDSRVQLRKPRAHGVTMVMDKGLGLRTFEDLLALAAPYIDFIKLGFGTLALTPTQIAQQKVELAKQYQVYLYPGGTFFEIAYAKQQVASYFQLLHQLGITWIEISSGVLQLSSLERTRLIQLAKDEGFQVITEIGQKAAGSITPIDQLIEQYDQDVTDGASYVIIEGRETGENIGIFNENGEVDEAYVSAVAIAIGAKQIIWEAPKRAQQVRLMQLLGPQVNIGNIAPADILSVESLRQGLRADTFHLWAYE